MTAFCYFYVSNYLFEALNHRSGDLSIDLLVELPVLAEASNNW